MLLPEILLEFGNRMGQGTGVGRGCTGGDGENGFTQAEKGHFLPQVLPPRIGDAEKSYKE